MKKFFEIMKKKGAITLLTVCMFLETSGITAFADTTEDANVDEVVNKVTRPLDVIYLLMIRSMQVVGGIIFAKNLWDLSTSIKAGDDSGTSSAIKGIIGGAILAAGGTFIDLFIS